MKTIPLILVGLLIGLPVLAKDDTPDPAKGKLIFQENPQKCMRCHAEGQEFMDKERSKSISELENWVRACDIRFKTSWYDDEVLHVVEYLNETYYNFPPEPSQKPNKGATASSDDQSSSPLIDTKNAQVIE